jgi:hypothetical protein
MGALKRLVPLMLVTAPLVSGCGKAAPPPSDRTAIEGVADWHRIYTSSHGRKPPADEAAFLDFVEAELKERGQQFDRATFLISPRDGQKYVIQYGKAPANLSADRVVVHEGEGYDGKVLVAYQMGRSAEIDAAELPALVPAQP